MKGRGLFRIEETLIRLNHSYLATSTFPTVDRYRRTAIGSLSHWLAIIPLIWLVARPWAQSVQHCLWGFIRIHTLL